MITLDRNAIIPFRRHSCIKVGGLPPRAARRTMLARRSQPNPKRARLEDAPPISISMLLEAHVPAQRLLMAAAEAPAGRRHSLGTLRKLAHNKLYEFAKKDTPYGLVLKTVAVDGDLGRLVIEYACPLALLWLAAHRNPLFGAFLVTCLAGAVGSIALYNDGVMPGNAMRPDKGRHYEAIYWSVLQFPSWVRERFGNVGWIALAYVLTVDMQHVGLTMSALNCAMLKLLWPESTDEFSLDTTGVRLRVGDYHVHVRFKFTCFLADDLAHTTFASSMGQSASKPCLCCGNILGRIALALVQPDMVHFTDPDMAKWERHTRDTYNEMAQVLHVMANDGTDPKVLKFTARSFGLRYNPRAILWDPHARHIAKLPDCIYWDWQHNTVASGGVGQYHVNQFVRAIVKENISLGDLDDFTSTVVLPRCTCKLRKDFWRTRIVNKPGKHIRAFASEMLTAIMVLGAFVDSVLAPQGSLPEHVKCFNLFRTIIDIFRMGEAALGKLDLLERCLLEHHVEFLRLYFECAKFKIHALRHIVECFRRFLCNLSCFSTERRHKFSKSIAAFTYNRVGKSMIAHDINEFFKTTADATAFDATRLLPPVSALGGLSALFAPMGVLTGVWSSKRMSTSKGTFYKGDLLFWVDNGQHNVGIAQLFMKAQFANQPDLHVAHVTCFQRVVGPVYSYARPVPMLVNSDVVRCSLPYEPLGTQLRVIFPTVL